MITYHGTKPGSCDLLRPNNTTWLHTQDSCRRDRVLESRPEEQLLPCLGAKLQLEGHEAARGECRHNRIPQLWRSDSSLERLRDVELELLCADTLFLYVSKVFVLQDDVEFDEAE